MVVAERYAETAVGAVPQGWRLCSLDDLAHKITTGKLDANAMSADGEYRFYTCAAEYYYIDRYAFDGEALLISGNGANVGYVHYYHGKFNAYQRTYVLMDFSASAKYLAYYLSQMLARRIATEVKAGNTPYITRGTLTDMTVAIPEDRDEQDAIAAVLTRIDDYIESLQALLVKKRALKQGAMQELLTGARRLPGFTGEWQTLPFERVFSRINAKQHQIQTSGYQNHGAYPVIDQGQKPVAAYSDRADLVFKCPTDGVVIFGDHTCIVKYVTCDFIIGADGTQVLQAVDGQSARFHAFQLQYRGIEPTGYNRHFKFLVERSFLAPKLDEQIAVASVLADIDVELTQVEIALEKAQNIKQGMMQELLTGRIRLV